VRIDHAVRATLYHRMNPRARAELHRRIATHVEDPRLRLRHRMACSDGYDATLASEAADLASQEAARGAWHEVAQWELGVARCDPSPSSRAAATLRAAQALVVAGEPGAAEQVLGDVDDATGDAALVRARIAAARGDLRHAADLLEGAWRATRDTRSSTASAIASHLAAIEFADARGQEAARWARRALAADATDVGLTDVDPRSRLLLSLLVAGRLQDAARESARQDRDRDADPRTDGTFGRAVVAAATGSPEAARAQLAELAGRAHREGPLPLWAFVQCWRSALAFRAGDWEDASTQATAATVAADHESWSFAAAAYACRSMPLAGRGEWEDAHRALSDANAAAQAAGSPQLVTACIVAAEAWLAFVRGDHREVMALTDPLAQEPFAHVPMLAGPPTAALRGLCAVRNGDPEVLEAVLEGLDAHATPLGAAWARTLVALRTGVQVRTTASAEALQAAVHAIDSDHPVDDALLRTELGAALRRAGRRAEAATQLDRAAATFERLGAGPLLRRVDAERSRLGRHRGRRGDDTLTAGEQAVADLAAQGWSNKEIAADLVLSVKTVEFHLSNVFRKLGVANRTQLANRNGGRSDT
jgi:ATP/maltotriose-dependent transcriptional regulator MalT